MHDISTDPGTPTTMRKRKRGYGSYVDEDTGEVTTVQTTKQARRNHQKSGKWYKEPTEQELRAWEREEKKQAAAERVARREENKKINAAKRAEQEAKAQQLKRQMFEAGKITFTQTLAKKDEGQLNLHSWFGGHPQQPKSREALAGAIEHNANKEQKEDKDPNANGHAARRLTPVVRSLSHQPIDDCEVGADKDFFIHKPTSTYKEKLDSMANPQQKDKIMDQMPDLDQDEFDLLNSSQNFDIAEDSDAEAAFLGKESDRIGQHAYNVFKVPPPSSARDDKRLPLSAMSQSDLNVRASQSLQVSNFKDRLAKADITTKSSTQAVRDILFGICTQDLALDLEDDLEEAVLDDKENNEPDSETFNVKTGSPIKKSSPLKQMEIAKLAPQHQSFTSINDSFDYNDIFAELNDDGDDDKTECLEDFDDYGLDDAFLSALPLTQMVSSAQTLATFALETTNSRPSSYSVPTRHAKSKEPSKRYDSFAVEGLDDDDLLEGLEEYERSQKMMATPLTHPKKKRVLPWEKQAWAADTTGAEEADEPLLCTQDTETG